MKFSKCLKKWSPLVALFGFTAFVVFRIFFPPVNAAKDIQEVRRLLSRGDYEQGVLQSDRLLSKVPDSSDALIVKGECLQRLNRVDEALLAYASVKSDGSRNSIAARLTEASIFLNQGHVKNAIAKLADVLRTEPENPLLNSLMASALTATGRRWESFPYLRNCLQAGIGDTLNNLIYLAVPDQMPHPNEEFLAILIRNKDSQGAIGVARVAMAMGEVERAEEFLTLARSEHPDLAEIEVQYGTLMLNENRHEEFLGVMRSPRKELLEHPEYWLLQGRYAQETGNPKTAIRCYWEVLLRHPDHDRACYQLGQLLAAEGRHEESRPFIERAGRLSQLVEKASILYDRPDDQTAMASCAEMTLALGRYRECRFWCEAAMAQPLSSENLQRVRTTIASLIDKPDVWQAGDLNIALHHDFKQFPLPVDTGEAYTTSELSRGSSLISVKSSSGIRFSDTAADVGLRFSYRNGSDATTDGQRMFEYTGGGVAAFDLDLDGHCDIHFTQGTDWPPNPEQKKFLDCCFRNIRGGNFQDVAIVCGLADSGFGQGVSAADVDNDGFPDLYVCNINGNRLYHNNGDGTFDDITVKTGLGHQYWSTSSAIADLNGDALPDIYDVTFLQGDDIFTKICTGEDGIARSCAPATFDAAPDFIWENMGDGTFRQFASDSGFQAPDGDGLGILISDFDESGDLSIFVANDGRANFYFTRLKDGNGSANWQEIGVINGSAFDARGRAKACMGVAASDFNQDGLLDMFVTNFYQEGADLLVNMGANTFLEQSKRFGLYDSTFVKLGFGTQALDADLDLRPDLVIANGHVDDFRHRDIPYKMQPQFFRNQDGNRFEEIPSDSLGHFFATEHLGRGMALIDWNGDFRGDIIISQLDEPSALLTNLSDCSGTGTGLSLFAVNSARDAVGSCVVLEAGDQKFHHFVTAGDGYQASNAREFILATPMQHKAIRIRVNWISGAEQVFEDVIPGKHYVAIEGHTKLFDRP